MQGPGSSVTTLPENIIFDNGSTSSDAGVDSQMPWNNNIQISAQNRLPDYIIPSSETTHNQYLQHSRNDMRNGEWCLGETSSRATLDLEQRQYGPYNILSSDRVEINPARNQITSGSFLLPNSSSNAVPQDLNMSLEFEDQDDDDDDCQVIEPPGSRVSVGSANEQIRSNSGGPAVSYGGPACGGFVMDESEDRPRMSCKRKTLEGQSSGVGTSNCFQTALPENNISMPIQAASHIVINNGPEQANPRLGLGVGRPVSSSPFSATAPGIPESSRRNFRLRINGLHHHQDPITTENPFLSDPTDVGNVDVSSSQHSSRLVLRNRMLDLNPVENGSPQGQSALLDVPSVRRIHQSRWTGSSSSRRSSRSSSAIASISEEGPAQRTFPRRISEHPMFVPASETRNSSQNPTNWNLSGVGNINNDIAGNIAYTSRVGSSRGESLSAPSWPHRSFPQYPRRLSEIVRRSLLSSAAGNGSGDRSVINHVEPLGSSASAPDNHGRHVPISRSTLLERHLDGASGVPYSWRTLAGASEGRSSLMSEQIRHVLDLMRRGEGLRFEDVMILDHSVLFGMADIHDRHRDMRLDVDNMSYEELLALEERIGNVCTGLTEETILSRLKQRLYVDSKLEDQVETEPCSICREEYIDGEDLGSLECGHDFHKECIKQWLMHKNLCPICKTTGLTT